MRRVPQLSTEIFDMKKVQRGSRSYVVFKIQVEWGELRWIVERRYKEFCCLNAEIAQQEPKLIENISHPLPGRRYLSRWKKDSLSQRQTGLNAYLQALHESVSAAPFETRYTLAMFLDVPMEFASKAVLGGEVSQRWDSEDDSRPGSPVPSSLKLVSGPGVKTTASAASARSVKSWKSVSESVFSPPFFDSYVDVARGADYCITDERPTETNVLTQPPGSPHNASVGFGSGYRVHPHRVRYPVSFDGALQALRNADEQAVRAILSQSPALMLQSDERGDTLLHLAAMFDEGYIACVLVQSFNADTTVRNRQGLTPLEAALPETKTQIEAALEIRTTRQSPPRTPSRIHSRTGSKGLVRTHSHSSSRTSG